MLPHQDWEMSQVYLLQYTVCLFVCFYKRDTHRDWGKNALHNTFDNSDFQNIIYLFDCFWNISILRIKIYQKKRQFANYIHKTTAKSSQTMSTWCWVSGRFLGGALYDTQAQARLALASTHLLQWLQCRLKSLIKFIIFVFR